MKVFAKPRPLIPVNTKANIGVEKIPLKTVTVEETDESDPLRPEDSVVTAGEVMREHDAAEWPVAEGEKLVGVVDQENPDWQLCGHGHDPNEWTVGEIMSRDLHYCFEDQDCATALRLMQQFDFQYLPVVDREMRIVKILNREQIVGNIEPVN